MTTGFHPGAGGSGDPAPDGWGGEYFPTFLLVSVLIHVSVLAAIFMFPRAGSSPPPRVSWVRLTDAPEPVGSVPLIPPVSAPSVRQPARPHAAIPTPAMPPVVQPDAYRPAETEKPPAALDPPVLPTLPGESVPPAQGAQPPALVRPGVSAPTPHEILFDDEAIARASRPVAEIAGAGKSDITFDTREFKYAGYMRQLKRHIEGVWKYPEDALERNVYGDLFITFTIRKDGTLGSVRLSRTSGFKSLDDAALAALRNSAPFWPLPEWWDEDGLTINGHFIYTLSGHYVR